MHGWLVAALVVALALGVIAKRLAGEPLNARDLWGAPLVLTAVGAWTLVRTAGLGAADIGWAVAGCLLGFALGAVRGRAVTVFEKDGVLWQRYTGRTFLCVVGTLAVMAAFTLAARGLGMHEEARPTSLSLGVSFLGEAVAVSLRALRTGVPFAPDRERAGLRR